MQVPNTNPHPEGNPEHDPHITQGRFNALKKEIAKLKNKLEYSQSEVARLAQLGDFSENVEYSLAKGRLRWLNRRILELESQVHRAEIIKPNKNAKVVELGHEVSVRITDVDGKILDQVRNDNQNYSTTHPLIPSLEGKQTDENKIKTYLILGPAEVNPEKNTISYLSPIGSALIGKKLGEKFKINIGEKEKEIEILKISKKY